MVAFSSKGCSLRISESSTRNKCKFVPGVCFYAIAASLALILARSGVVDMLVLFRVCRPIFTAVKRNCRAVFEDKARQQKRITMRIYKNLIQHTETACEVIHKPFCLLSFLFSQTIHKPFTFNGISNNSRQVIRELFLHKNITQTVLYTRLLGCSAARLHLLNYLLC